MPPELAAALVAVGVATLRELVWLLERRRRRRGELHTRSDDELRDD